MATATISEVMKMLAFVSAAYRCEEVTVETARAWHAFVGDIPPDSLMKAAVEHVKTSRFFPTPAEIRQRCVSVPDHSGAWLEVRSAIRRHGAWKDFAGSHPAITKAVAAMGWVTLCDMTSDDVGTYQGQFRRIYEQFAARAHEQEIRAIERGGEPDRDAVTDMTRDMLTSWREPSQVAKGGDHA